MDVITVAGPAIHHDVKVKKYLKVAIGGLFLSYRSRRRSMLTVKIMSPGGSEEIHSGRSVGFNHLQQSIAVSGMDNNVFLREGEIAYVMNENGKTISHYEHRQQ